jgi:hypothetical protein
MAMVTTRIDDEGNDPIFGFYRGQMEIVGDIMAPLYSDEEWEEFAEEFCAELEAAPKKRSLSESSCSGN